MTVGSLGLNYLAEHSFLLMVACVALLIAVAIFGLSLFALRSFIQRRVLKVADATLAQMTVPLEAAVTAASHGETDTALQQSFLFGRLILDRYAWMTLRNWVVQVMLSLVIAFGALIGSALLVTQNKLIQQQNLLSEASRRSSLVLELTAILDKVDEEIDQLVQSSPDEIKFGEANKPTSIKHRHTATWIADAKANILGPPEIGAKVHLSQHLYGRIEAVSHSFIPYRRLDDSGALLPPSSPERGLLLKALISSGVSLAPFRNTFIDLTYADLRGASFVNVSIDQLSFEHAVFDDADLRNSDLGQSVFHGCSFKRCDLRDAIFDSALLPPPSAFEGSNIENISLENTLVVSQDWLDQMSNLKGGKDIPAKFEIVRVWPNEDDYSGRQAKVSNRPFPLYKHGYLWEIHRRRPK